MKAVRAKFVVSLNRVDGDCYYGVSEHFYNCRIFVIQMFQKSVLDPQQKRVDMVLADAQDLIQSAAPGVSTSGLEADLEILTDKWAELNEKVSVENFKSFF